jgi:hypothetical protein
LLGLYTFEISMFSFLFFFPDSTGYCAAR